MRFGSVGRVKPQSILSRSPGLILAAQPEALTVWVSFMVIILGVEGVGVVMLKIRLRLSDHD